MIIAGLFSGYHDACACVYDDYRLVASVALERLTRKKSDGHRLPVEALDECLHIAGIGRAGVDAVALERCAYPARYFRLPPGRRLEDGLSRLAARVKTRKVVYEQLRRGLSPAEEVFDGARFLRDLGFRADTAFRFFNHHFAHALPALFHTDWDEALIYTADGGGDNVHASAHVFHDGTLSTIYGGDERLKQPVRVDSIGRAYAEATRVLGFKMNRHEGKLTGLAAYGEAVLYEEMAGHFHVEDDGAVNSDFASFDDMAGWMDRICAGVAREAVAASIQKCLEEVILASVGRLVERTGARHLGLAGGVFANVRLNQRLAEELPLDEVFIYPAMGDFGLACGGVLQFLLERDGLETWLANRRRLDHLYYGRDYGGEMDALLGTDDAFRPVAGDPARTTADLLDAGAVVAIYTRGMEYGPRALGARTILGAPVDREINDVLNKRLARTEFMPFAPVIAEADAETVFDLGPVKAYASRFMTITCNVKPQWVPRIPAVVHVDNTARPQVIGRAPNPLYYDILMAYKAKTGIPVLINTSFNAHEEPIINTPAECARALGDGRVDYVVTERGVHAGPKTDARFERGLENAPVDAPVDAAVDAA